MNPTARPTTLAAPQPREPDALRSREYERLAYLIDDDLPEVRDAALTGELHAILAASGVPSSGRSVKQVFLDAFFAREDVDAGLRAMADPAALLARRLLLREALPTLDALIVLAPDPFARTQVDRAAALAAAAFELHRRHGADHAGMLGATQVPGVERDHVVRARDTADLVVLADGRPYLVSDAARVSPDALAATLAWIVADARTRAPSAALRALTAASRPTCHALRARLAEDPENARAIAAIEGATLVLCLDAGAPEVDLRAASRGLFCTRGNRWYGAPQLVVDVAGNAALIEGYTRGIDAKEVVAFAEALGARGERPAPHGGESSSARTDQVTPLALRCSDDDPLLRVAEGEAALAFHGEDPFHSLAVDRRWFKSAELGLHGAVQVLLLLAAGDAWPSPTAPSLALAVRRSARDAALDWTLAPTRGLDALRGAFDRRAPDALARFRAHTERVNARVEACKQGPSPCTLFTKPEGALHDRLYNFYLRVGATHDSGYAAWLFRARRREGGVDLMTSTLALPPGVPWLCRPGATSRTVSKLGAHVLPREGSIDLVYIPNPARSGDLARFRTHVDARLADLRALAEAPR